MRRDHTGLQGQIIVVLSSSPARCQGAVGGLLPAAAPRSVPPSVRLQGGWWQRLLGRLRSAVLDSSSNSCHP